MATLDRITSGPIEWSVTDKDTNAASTATKAAPGARSRHFITGFTFSASAAPAAAAELLVKTGATSVMQLQIPAAAQGPLVVVLDRPIAGGVNEAVEITVGALGAGVVGAVSIHGFTGSI